MGDKVLQFVAYSNTDMDGIQRNSPKSAMVSQNVLSGNKGAGNFDAPSLANAVGSS